MKLVLSAIFFLLLYSCKNRNSEKEATEAKSNVTTPAKQDTFNLHDLDSYPVLQSDIFLDTIEVPKNKKHLGLSIIYPKFSPDEFPYLYKWVRKIVDDNKRDFYETIKDDEILNDTSELDMKYYGWVQPQLLYRTNKLISFVIGDGGGFNKGTSWFGYNALNLDFEKNREIKLNDYFILNTKSDSAFLENVFQRCVNKEFSLKQYQDFPQDFAFDSSTVYFLFEKYHILAWGNYSVEKKYIFNHINPAYR